MRFSASPFSRRRLLSYSAFSALLLPCIAIMVVMGVVPRIAGAAPPKIVMEHHLPIQVQSPSIYLGVHATSWLQNLTPVTTFEQDAGKQASIIMWYQGWGDPAAPNFQSTWMDNVREHGSIPLISWEPWDYRSNSANQPMYALQNIINGRFDAYITRWAQASKAWGHPYFLRFAAEMNGYWFPWSEEANGNRPGQYVQAWRHVHDIFTRVGATNVSWVWSPNIVFPGNIPLQGLYPGSSYVDWVAMDGYNWSSIGKGHHWQSFADIFQKTYTALVNMSLHKPMMIAETGSSNVGGNEAAWITDAFTVQLPQHFPLIKAFVWFNQNKETDWRIESSAATHAAFAHAMSSNIYASNYYSTLNTSPIPAP